MTTKRILVLIGITILGTVLLTVLWEFVLEYQIMTYFHFGHGKESLVEKCEYVITTFVFVIFAITGPCIALIKAFKEIKVLRGILPICASCKKIRDTEGHWREVEVYFRNHSEAEFSHGLCPACVAKMEKELEL